MTKIIDRRMPEILGGLMIAMALVRIPGVNMRLGFQMVFEAGVMLAFALFFLVAVDRAWGAFLMLATWSCLYPFYSKMAFLTLWSILIGALWYWVVIRIAKGGERNENLIMDAMCVIALANVVWQVFQVFGVDPFFDVVEPWRSNWRPATGFMANTGETSALLALCFPAFLWRRERWGRLGILIPVGGILLARSMTGLFACFAGWVFAQVMERRFKLSLGVALAGAAATVLFMDPGGGERFQVWAIAFNKFLEHPFSGSGLGHWQVVFFRPMVNDAVWHTAHNEFVQGFFEMGAFFAVPLCMYAWRIRRRYTAKALLPLAAVVTAAVASAGTFPFHIATTAMLAIAWMAVLESRLRIEN